MTLLYVGELNNVPLLWHNVSQTLVEKSSTVVHRKLRKARSKTAFCVARCQAHSSGRRYRGKGEGEGGLIVVKEWFVKQLAMKGREGEYF